MKPIIILFIALAGLLVSCYKPYITDIDKNNRVLVVDGLITDENASYRIRLSYSAAFDSIGTGVPLTGAEVYISDDLGNIYLFNEWDHGEYKSDPLQFRAHPGNTYTLHIKTLYGEEYESDPQKLFAEASPDSVYAEFDYKEVLSRTTGLKVLSHGANILADIRNKADTLPRFRFTSNLVTQYFYTICPFMQPCISFYCWKTDNANSDINLTGGEYSVNSASINKHAVCFIDDNRYCYAMIYEYVFQGPGLPYKAVGTTEYQSYDVYNRLLYLNQYTLNNESYTYYKRMDEQLRSEGKLFDPIAVQLNGNIKCITNPEQKAFGFFEASSVSYSAYTIDFRHLTNAQPSILKIPYILPPESNGCRIDIPPAFWVY